MISDTINIRPRYVEVDRSGNVYHSHYVNYCHQARTELFRKYGLNSKVLKDNGISLQVLNFCFEFTEPAQYDEQLTIKTSVKQMPKENCTFHFEIKNEKNKVICTSTSTILFIDKETFSPIETPHIVEETFKDYLDPSYSWYY